MVSPVPSGTVSFLFTDVVGSTRSWEDDPAGTARGIEMHDEIVKRRVAEAGGHVFSTAGDGFGVAFATAHEALATAVRIQRELLTARWPGSPLEVRMGLHTGTADERDGDYFGPVVNRAARIQASGHGGQILISATTAEAAASGLDSDTTLVDLGLHRLRDVEEPLRLYDVRHTALPVVTEPLRTQDALRHNLPEFLTSFVGRDEQMERLDELLAEHRLVVLTGVGGTGKTRLAVEAGHRQLPAYRDGVWLVELAPVTDPSLVMTAIGDTWGLRPGEGAPIADVVARYLRERELLVVIDNCEHVLEAAAGAIRHILDSAPGVRVIATSRESVGLPGEALLHVPSLGLPSDSDEIDSESAQLFLERAADVRPDFSPDAPELEAVARICRRVDGIPLGLELAAARLRSLSAQELADRLEDSFRILAGSAKASLPRQRTLSATIDWSHDLLETPDRTVFRRLAVFAGGFNLEAAEAVCPGNDMEGWEVLDHLDSLVDKSLVFPSHDPGRDTRYRMLEPVRQYAQERLMSSGEAAEVQRTHARHYVDMVDAASPRLRGPEQGAWLERLDADYANIRAAFTVLSETGDAERHLRMAFALFPYWMAGGMQLEAIDTALVGLREIAPGIDPLLGVKVWWTTAFLGAQITRPESIQHAREGLALADRLDDPNARGKMELALGAAIRHSTTDPEYLEHLVEGRRLLEEHPEPVWWDPPWERALIHALLFEYLDPDDPHILEHFEAAVAGFERLGDEVFLSIPLTMTTGVIGSMGNDWVVEKLRRAVEITERIGIPLWRGHARFFLGVMLSMRGDDAAAIEPIAAGAKDLEECGDLNCWAGASRRQAMAEAALGAPDDARRRLGRVLEALPSLPMRDLQRIRLVDAMTSVLVSAGEHERAAVALGLAEANELAVSLAAGRGLDSLRLDIVEVLGETKTAELAAEGAAWSLDEGVAVLEGWMKEGQPSAPRGGGVEISSP